VSIARIPRHWRKCRAHLRKVYAPDYRCQSCELDGKPTVTFGEETTMDEKLRQIARLIRELVHDEAYPVVTLTGSAEPGLLDDLRAIGGKHRTIVTSHRRVSESVSVQVGFVEFEAMRARDATPEEMERLAREGQDADPLRTARL
jgi:hypothetical protein